MSITFHVHPERRLVETRIEGDVKLEDVLRYMHALESTPGYVPTFDAIVDVRGTDATLDTNGLHAVAGRVRARPATARSRRAVVTGTDVTYGVMRMFEVFVGDAPTEYRAFRSMDEAMDWLGIDRSALRYLAEEPASDER